MNTRDYINHYMNTPMQIHTGPVIVAILRHLYAAGREGVLARDLRAHFCSKDFEVDYWWVRHEFDRIMRRLREDLKLVEPMMKSPGDHYGAVAMVGFRLTMDGWIMVEQMRAEEDHGQWSDWAELLRA